MKHHAFLGLIVCLVAAARLDAAAPTPLNSPVLFTVVFDNSKKQVTITGTGVESAQIRFTGNSGTVPTTLDTYNGGLTLINFFDQEPLGGVGNIIGARTLSVSVGGSPSLLDPFEVVSALNTGISNPGIDLTGLSQQNYNPGQNLWLASFDNLALSPTGRLTIENETTVTFPYSQQRNETNNYDPQFNFAGPLYVYAGYNNAFNGDSFLGTYTISVVPEPSTYAAIAGGLGLAAAVIHRRRQRAKAAQG
jgi:hypothetical protein